MTFTLLRFWLFFLIRNDKMLHAGIILWLLHSYSAQTVVEFHIGSMNFLHPNERIFWYLVGQFVWDPEKLGMFLLTNFTWKYNTNLSYFKWNFNSIFQSLSLSLIICIYKLDDISCLYTIKKQSYAYCMYNTESSVKTSVSDLFKSNKETLRLWLNLWKNIIICLKINLY